jgi:hypothetical protein
LTGFVLLVVTGCASTVNTDTVKASDSRDEKASAFAREVTAPEAALLHAAEQELIRVCMAELGFPYWTIAYQPVPEYREFPYVVDDVAWARRHGYGGALEQRLRQLRISDPNTRYFAGLSTGRKRAALTAINGERPVGLEAVLPDGGVLRRSDGGCTSRAEHRLYGDVRTWFRVEQIVSSLGSMRRGRVAGDPRFQQAVQRWARCMRDAGHRYSNPSDLRASLPEPGPPRAHDMEVRLAVAEATCAHRSGLAAVARELDGHHAATLNHDHRDDVATKRRLELAAVPRARAILARR